MGIGNPFKSIEKKIRKGIEDLGNSVTRKVNDTGKSVLRNVNSSGERVMEVIRNSKSEAERSIQAVGKNVANEVEDKIEAAGTVALSEIQQTSAHLAQQIEDLTEKAIDELEGEVREELEALFAAAATKGLDTGLAVIKKAERLGETALQDASIGIGLSAVGLGWNNLGGRITAIREKVEGAIKKKPELSRQYIIEVINAVAPDTVSVALDVKLAALVVTSDIVGVDFNLTLSTPAFLEAADDLLTEIGL